MPHPMPQPRTRARRALVALTSLVAMASLLVTASFTVVHVPELAAQDADDQRAPDPTPVELTSGHVDIGPRLLDGDWRALVHDDAADPPVWRDPAAVVMRVGDAALVEVPDDPTYSFLDVAPGAPVHVLPQTQDPELVWIGWSTQDPEVAAAVSRGVTMRLVDVVGPGRLVVYLQAGNFSEPDVVWDSGDDDERSMWLDVDTHGHANWVFTRPGAHLLRVEMSAQLEDGTEVSDMLDLRVAVGDDVSADDVATLAASTTPAASDGGSAAGVAEQDALRGTTGAVPGRDDSLGSTAVLGLAAAAALALAASVAVVVGRGRATKRRATASAEGARP